jgi:hypothetical protein
MDAEGFSSFSFSVWAVLAIVIGVILAYLIFVLLRGGKTIPRLAEGFGAPVVGAGMPDCLHESSEAAALVGMFAERIGSVEEGRPDLQELTLICSKLACMKRDLVGVNGRVNATLYQPFSTAHDVEPVAETVGRCFAKTIPPRDLEISFDKWKGRGRFLIKRLCAAANLNETESRNATGLFDGLLVDVYDIASQKCLPGQPDLVGEKTGAREAKPYSAPELEYLREYTGYY